MIHVGTSGFSYADWIGSAYPEGTAKRDMLPLYSRLFDTVEIDATFYAVPGLKTVASWIERSPRDFSFSVKAHKSLTHERENPDFSGFQKAVMPLFEAGKLACVLLQLPYSFHRNSENLTYLRSMSEALRPLPQVAEFRSVDWVGEETFDLLRELGVGYCCVDEPHLRGLMPPVAVVTSDKAYVRFHGRNAAHWWEHEQAAQRYDYSYSEAELREWVPRVGQLSRESEAVYVYFNNHVRGQAVQNAQLFLNLISD
jgi:uncharacterized protein YecE (DUF72 family)